MTAESQPVALPPDVFDKLRQVSTSTLATQLYRRGFRQPTLIGVRALSRAVASLPFAAYVREVTITGRSTRSSATGPT